LSGEQPPRIRTQPARPLLPADRDRDASSFGEGGQLRQPGDYLDAERGASQGQTVSDDVGSLQTAIGNATLATDPGIASGTAALAAGAKTAALNSPPKCSGLNSRHLEGIAAPALGATDVAVRVLARNRRMASLSESGT